MRKVAVVCFLFLLLTACNNNEQSVYTRNEDDAGTQFVQHKNNGIDQRDLRDYSRNTNQNPNFIDLSPEQPTRGTDEDKAEEVIQKYTKYELESVWINGQNMNVTVSTNEEIQDRQKQEKEVRDTLTRALPRYIIDVKITKQ
ncbi:MAG TPA: hypothetical protein VEY51_19520 [Chondromyces sp.]|nr:hypothetical protein [Chondromyces sp.]